MARALRVEFPGALYHVFSRGVARMETFRDDRDRIEFLGRIGGVVAQGLLEIYAYCLMANHFHLLCQTPLAGLGDIMRTLLSGYSRWFNRRHSRVGHLWQGRYKALLVQDGYYLVTASRYIHLNPYSSLQIPASEYVWSSYRRYLGLPGAVDWVKTERILSAFPGVPAYQRYVEATPGVQDPFAQADGGLICGDEAFIKAVLGMVRDRPSNPEVPGLQQLRRSIDTVEPDEVQDFVERMFEDLSPCQRSRMMIYALAEKTGLKRVEIARRVGRSPGAVTHAVRSVRQRLEDNPRLRSRWFEFDRR